VAAAHVHDDDGAGYSHQENCYDNPEPYEVHAPTVQSAVAGRHGVSRGSRVLACAAIRATRLLHRNGRYPPFGEAARETHRAPTNCPGDRFVVRRTACRPAP
jgi:hypothetical protein